MTLALAAGVLVPTFGATPAFATGQLGTEQTDTEQTGTPSAAVTSSSVSPSVMEISDESQTVTVTVSLEGETTPSGMLRHVTSDATVALSNWHVAESADAFAVWEGTAAVTGATPPGTWVAWLDDPATELGTVEVRPEGLKNTVAPQISGTPVVGGTLQTSVGDWRPLGPTTAVEWLRDGQPIPGATNATYTLTPSDAKTRISTRVSATLAGSSHGPTVATSSDVFVGLGAARAGTVVITGKLQMGQTARAAVANWPSGAALSYQWKRDGAAIAGATRSSYAFIAADVGARVTVQVTGRSTGYEVATATAALPKAVAAGALQKSTPKLTGSAVVGQSLSVQRGAWSAGAKLTYQWKRNGAAIKGATSATYRLVAADGGAKITVTLTGKLPGYTTATATSSAKQILRLLRPATPKVTGTDRVGSTLSAQAGTWGPQKPKLSYRWLREGKEISGATRATYALTKSDAGKRVSVRVTGSKTGYQSESKTSVARHVPLVMRAAKPKISGSSVVGSRLTAVSGSWTSGTKLKYQWYRGGSAISGATSPSYGVRAADVGSSLSVRVSGSKSGYASESRTSKGSARVKYPSRTPGQGWNCPAWAPIKGNASSHIYHVPGGAYYNRTKPEECFSTTWAAEAAGYRASLR
ncbi:hypothetical protein ACFWHR_05375 [Leucobacter sp. NPDC058333]|uniref:sunset domain-containing protein n=1 Tax=Leucobacter sp. NPDC058333 TaxID=3346450 RepID=UPI00365B191D